MLVEELLEKDILSDEDIIFLLNLRDKKDCEKLQQAAYKTTGKYAGNNIYFRGLIEISNICTTDCRYCGIRKSNHALTRYTLERDVILECADIAVRNGYGSIAIQAGERRDPQWIAWISELLEEIHARSVSELLPHGLGITLSLGEQTLETYQRWAEASANPSGLRYLLRLETTNPELFSRLHSAKGRHEKRLENRIEALRNLRLAGYQVGTGVMIGLPGQSAQDLVRDIRTFKALDADMIGMGPYLVSQGGNMIRKGMLPHDELRQLSLNMIALTRLVLKDVNIAAATALETLTPGGRIEGILYGCNVIMPNITPQKTRSSYQLYDNKAGTEVGEEANRQLEKDIRERTGRVLGLHCLGSSQHWQQRTSLAYTTH